MGKNRTVIEKCKEEKDLGVIFDGKLSFDKHIHEAISKANQILGIRKRSFTYMDKEIFLNLYKSMVRPHLEYGNTIWGFPNRKGQSASLEKVQRRATRILPELRDLDYAERLRCLNLPSLKYRRFRGDMIQTYKIIYHVDDVCSSNFFRLNKTISTRSSEVDLYPVHMKLNIRKFSFSNRVINAWNSLTYLTKTAPDLNRFKALLDCDPKTSVKMYDYDE